MNVEELREYCLSKSGAAESLPFGPDTLVFKVKDKIFLLLSIDEPQLQFNVKCDPDEAILLRDKYTSVQPGYHMNKRHWNTIICDGSVNKKLLLEWIDHSYNLVAGNKKGKP